MTKVRLFVYGTLKKNFSANHMLGPAALLLGSTQIPGVLVSMGHFPGLFKDGVCEARGEVWEIAEGRLELLDSYEGVHRGFYTRKKIPGIFGQMYYYEMLGEDSLKKTRLVAKEGVWRQQTYGPVNDKNSPLWTYEEELAFWTNIKGEDAPNAGVLHDTETGETRPNPANEKLKAALDRVYGPDADRSLNVACATTCPIPEPEKTPLVIPKLG